MDPVVKIFGNIDELAYYFAVKLESLVQANSERKTFSIALSGGSTPKKIFEYIASRFSDRLDWNKLLVFWGDERSVPPDSEESNFRMASESLLDRVPIPGSNIFRIRGEADPESEARRYSELVMSKVPMVDDIPQFDMVMLGMGDDGHTASIFPGSMHLFNSDKLFEVAVNPYSGQQRITATGKLINHARVVVFLVTGHLKAEVLSRVIERREGWEKVPASAVQPLHGELIWLLDKAAAGNL